MPLDQVIATTTSDTTHMIGATDTIDSSTNNINTTSSIRSMTTAAESTRAEKMSFVKVFPCNTCNLKFEDSQTQRLHMREPWHVYNLKRRVEDLEPVSEEAFAKHKAHGSTPRGEKSPGSKQRPKPRAPGTLEDDDQVGDVGVHEDMATTQVNSTTCMFCSNISDDVENNIRHLSSEHGLHIPSVERLSSPETFVKYLQVVVNECCECLYCGVAKQSAEDVRRHMLDKGHCMIDLEREPELKEFWDQEGSEISSDDTSDESKSNRRARKTGLAASIDVAHGEYTLPSGKLIRTKSSAREAHRLVKRLGAVSRQEETSKAIEGFADGATAANGTDLVLLQEDAEKKSQSKALNVRDSRGLVGLNDQQLRSVVMLERKMRRKQAAEHAAAPWADELGGRSQKHFKTKMDLRSG